MSKIIKNSNAIGGALFFTGSITDNLTASVNNYTIPTLDNFVLVRLTSNANYNVTGLVPPDITLGWYVIIYNVGTNTLTLKNNDANSSANNRFLLGTDKNLQGDEGVALVYDTVSLRWRSFGINI